MTSGTRETKRMLWAISFTYCSQYSLFKRVRFCELFVNEQTISAVEQQAYY